MLPSASAADDVKFVAACTIGVPSNPMRSKPTKTNELFFMICFTKHHYLNEYPKSFTLHSTLSRLRAVEASAQRMPNPPAALSPGLYLYTPVCIPLQHRCVSAF